MKQDDVKASDKNRWVNTILRSSNQNRYHGERAQTLSNQGTRHQWVPTFCGCVGKQEPVRVIAGNWRQIRVLSTWLVPATGVTPGPRHHQLQHFFSFKLEVWHNCLIRGSKLRPWSGSLRSSLFVRAKNVRFRAAATPLSRTRR